MERSAEQIGAAATRAILYEVAATPKPGLVDCSNAGAHRDMDLFTFLSSASALAPYFTQMAQWGARSAKLTPAEAFSAARPMGAQAEREMFAATNGINTHKGAVFSIGLACLAAGRMGVQGEVLTHDAVTAQCAALTEGLCAREYGGLRNQSGSLTKGERMYLEHGITGVRGEAEAGFPHVREVGYPVLAASLARGDTTVNDCMLHTLLRLLAAVEDTNVLGRCGLEAARYAREQAHLLLEAGGLLRGENRLQLMQMDERFIQRGISPGGCADLLALTLFLYQLERPGELPTLNQTAGQL